MKLGLIAVLGALVVGCGGSGFEPSQDRAGDPAPQGDDAGRATQAPGDDAGAPSGGDAGQAVGDAGDGTTGQQDAGKPADGATASPTLDAASVGCGNGQACAVATDLCGGSTVTLNDPADACGHVCMGTKPTSDQCQNLTKGGPFDHYVEDTGCSYYYVIGASGLPQVEPAGTTGCVANVNGAGSVGLCCP